VRAREREEDRQTAKKKDKRKKINRIGSKYRRKITSEWRNIGEGSGRKAGGD
jgi:hypothetical protein